MKEIIYKIRLVIAILMFVIMAVTGVLLISPAKYSVLKIMPDVSLSAFIIFFLVFLIILTLLFGRVYCSLACPLGIFQEIITLIAQKDSEKRPNWPFKYFIAVITIGLLIYGFYNFNSSFVKPLLIVTILVFVLAGILAIFKNRFFCTDICPAGAILGLLSKISLFKLSINKNECISCGMCERNCPSGCIDSCEETIENETCVKCLKCMANCPKDAIKYSVRNKSED